MPGSLLGLGTKVKRNDSTRSDRSDVSAHSNDSRTSVKKVSFNKAVRVKKYPLRSEEYDDSELDVEQPGPGRRFWFKVYKSKPHRDSDWNNELWSQEEECETSWGDGYEDDNGGRDRHQERAKLTPIAEDGDVSSDDSKGLHSSQLPPDPPTINRNHVKNIVSRFNEELTKLRKKRQEALHAESKDDPTESQPLEPPADYEDTSQKDEPLIPVVQKSKPVVNGVKSVMTSLNVGMATLRRKVDKNGKGVREKNVENLKKNRETLDRKAKPLANGHVMSEHHSQYTKRPVTVDHRATDSRRQATRKNTDVGKKGWDKADTLRNDTKITRHFHSENKRDSAVQVRVDATADRLSEGQTTKVSTERHNPRQMVHDSRVPTTGKRSRSHDDILSTPRSTVKRVDKAVSTDDLYKTVTPNSRFSIKPTIKALTLKKTSLDKAVQCNGIGTSFKSGSTLTTGTTRVSRSQNSYTPLLSEKSHFVGIKNNKDNSSKHTTESSVSRVNKMNPIYGELKNEDDKGKEETRNKTDSTYAVSNLANYILNSNGKYRQDYFATTRNLSSSQKNSIYKPMVNLENGHDEVDRRNDCDQQSLSKESTSSKIHKYSTVIDLLPAIQEPPDRLLDDETTAGSVIREVDFKKQEISYENVPREDNEPRDVDNGMWFHQNGEDYRREMAQMFPPKSRTDSDFSFLTFNRAARSRKGRSPLPKMYSSEYSFLHESEDTEATGVTETDANDNDLLTACHSNGYTSFCDDSLYGTVELSNTYTSPRQKSPREYTRLFRESSLERRETNDRTSTASVLSSCDSDGARRRKPLVMFIPGVSHHDCPAEEEDRMSNLSVARSQISHHGKTNKCQVSSGKEQRKSDDTVDLLKGQEDTVAPLPAVSKRKSNVSRNGTDQRDIRRRHSMPKDAKLAWLKWKGKGKPSREP